MVALEIGIQFDPHGLKYIPSFRLRPIPGGTGFRRNRQLPEQIRLSKPNSPSLPDAL